MHGSLTVTEPGFAPLRITRASSRLRPDNRLQGCGAVHVAADDRLARLPRTADPWASGPWASIAAAAGDPSRGCRVFDSLPGSGGEASHHLAPALPVHREAHQLVVRVAHLPPAAGAMLSLRAAPSPAGRHLSPSEPNRS